MTRKSCAVGMRNAKLGMLLCNFLALQPKILAVIKQLLGLSSAYGSVTRWEYFRNYTETDLDG